MCTILTDILNPLAEKSPSNIENSYELKKALATIQIDENDIQPSFDVVALYPSIPVEKALSCTRERLMKDEMLSDRQTGIIERFIGLIGFFCLIALSCIPSPFRPSASRADKCSDPN